MRAMAGAVLDGVVATAVAVAEAIAAVRVIAMRVSGDTRLTQGEVLRNTCCCNVGTV